MTNESNDNECKVLHEWLEDVCLRSRTRYRMVRKEPHGKILYRRREEKNGEGDWEVQSPRSGIWEDAPDEKTPDHVRAGWEDVPTEFEDVSPDADW